MPPASDTPIAFVIHFDPLAYGLGYPDGFRDPSWTAVADRFLDIARARDLRYSIFVLGRDLENPEIAARVRDWAAEGHEIGNHSWSHPMDFGAMAPSRIESEILRTHEAILRATGGEPAGFAAPVWSVSRAMYRILAKHNYAYSTSLFPSLTLWPVALKVALNMRKMPSGWEKMRQALNRRDWLAPLVRPRRPHLVDAEGRPVASGGDAALVELPLPTSDRFAFPLWHTLGFVLGWERAQKKMTRLAAESPYFHYLMHPADLAGRDDLADATEGFFERMDEDATAKRTHAERMIDLALASGRNPTTMRELARRFHG